MLRRSRIVAQFLLSKLRRQPWTALFFFLSLTLFIFSLNQGYSLSALRASFAFERSHVAMLSAELEESWASHAGLLGSLRTFCATSGGAWPICSRPPLAPERRGGIDFLVLAVKPTCVHSKMLKSLEIFANPKPKIVHIVTKSQAHCPAFEVLSPRVRCYGEDSVVVGLTYDRVRRHLEGTKHASDSVHLGRRLAGWYLQQFLKLAGGDALVPADEDFVIWDADMVLVRPIDFFGGASDAEGRHDPGGGLPLLRGGGRPLERYEGAYRQLFGGRQLERDAAGGSLVAHHLPVRRELLREFLQEIDPQYPEDPANWALRALDAVAEADVDLGFSEYWYFASWMLQRPAPPPAVLMPGKPWERAVPLAPRGVHSMRQCCPGHADYDRERARRVDLLYVGWEIGHFEECQYPLWNNHYP